MDSDSASAIERNRNLDMKKVKMFREKWSQANGEHLQRTEVQNAIIVTIDAEHVLDFLDHFKNDQGLPVGPKHLRHGSRSSMNPQGIIYKLPKTLRESAREVLRCEAGQHRLEAISQMEVGRPAKVWPAQVYARRFEAGALSGLRKNVQLFNFGDKNEDAIYKLSKFFTRQDSLSSQEEKVFDTLWKGIGGKMRTSLNKSWGLVIKRLVGKYPNFCTGWNENKAAGLNRSLHNDVRGLRCSWKNADPCRRSAVRWRRSRPY